MVGVLSAVNVVIQKLKRAVRLVAHIDKLNAYLGDAPAVWGFGDEPDAADECLTEPFTSLDFTRVGNPISPGSSDNGSGQEVENIPNPVGNLSTPLAGCEGSSDRGICQDTQLEEVRPTRMRRPPMHLRDYHCRRITLVVPSFQVTSRMADEPDPAKGPVYQCWQYARKNKEAGSLSRHLLELQRFVILISNAAYVGLHGVTAEQVRLLSLEDPEDLATFAARRRRFRPDSVESIGPPKTKKEQRVPSSSGEMHLTGVGSTLSRPALTARMVAAGKPSRGHPQEPAGSDTGASLLHASGLQSY